MACTIKIAKDIQSKYGLPEEMPEADFNAWLANGGLQLLSDDKKISIDGYRIVKNGFEEILSISKSVIKSVKLSIDRLKTEIAKAKKEGAKEAISDIDFWQGEAKAFLAKKEIKITDAIKAAIGKIKNNLTFARFLITVQSQQDAAAYFAKAEGVKELLKDIGKLKKSDKLTASNKEFIKNTSFPSAMEVSDLDTYAAILQEFIDKRNGESTFGNINEKLTKFIEKENAYINSYKSNIAALKETLEDLALEEEYEALAKEGAFKGTGIKSVDDYKNFWLGLEEFLGVQAETEKQLEDISKSKRVKEVTQNIKTTLEQFAKELKQAFDLANTEAMPLDFSILEKGDLSGLALKELVLLSNILDGILYDGDFTGYDNIRSKLEQNKRKAGLLNSINKTIEGVKKLINISNNIFRPSPTTIASQAYGMLTEANLDAFVMGKWNTMISQTERLHNMAMSEFDKQMKSLGSKAFESSVAIDTFGFINQSFEGLTQAEIDADFQNDYTVYAASAKTLYNAIANSVNTTATNKVDALKAQYALEALERFGLIKDLTFSKTGVTFKVNEGMTQADIQGKLNAKEQAFYDFLVDSFAQNRPAFINGMQIGLGKLFRGITNYLPRVSKYETSEETDKTVQQIISGFSNVSRTQNVAKDRDLAKGSYHIGLRENFSKGYWENLLVAYGQQQVNDIVNSLYSTKFGMKSLVKKEVLNDVGIMMNAIKNQVTKQLTFGNVNLKSENLLRNELFNLVSSKVYGYILTHPYQLIKQTIPALVTSLILQPKTTFLANKILMNRALADKIIDNSTIIMRSFKHMITPSAKKYPPEYVTGAKGSVYKGMQFITNKINIGDIIKPSINKIRQAFDKPVVTDQLLDFGDTYISRFNVVAGYIEYLKEINKGITDEQLLEKIKNEPIDEVGMAASETWQRLLNSISSPAQQAKIFANSTAVQILFMFKSFQTNTHQEFWKNARRLIVNGRDLTPEERGQTAKAAIAYAIQQITFRGLSALLSQYTIAALLKGADDDDKDKVYKYKKIWSQFWWGWSADILLGSYGIVSDVAIALASNYYWNKQKEEYVNEIRKTDPNFDPKGTPLDPNKPLLVAPQLGGSIASTGELLYEQYNEWTEEVKILEKAGLPPIDAKMYPLMKAGAFITGSGTFRDFATGVDNLKDKEIKRINALMGEIKGQYGFEYEFENKEDLIKLSKTDISPSELAKLSLFIPTSESKGFLYIMPKSSVEKAKKQAEKAIYAIEHPTQAEAIKAPNVTPFVLNPNASEEKRAEMAREQFKQIYNAFLQSHLADKGVVKYPIVAKK